MELGELSFKMVILLLSIKLPEETIVYPAHDYNGKKFSTVGEQKKTNPRLQVKNVEEYVNIMKNLKLEPPKMIDIALPANIKGTSI
jgi:sulfur dioxygenase